MDDWSSLLTLLFIIAGWLVASFLVGDYAKNKGLNPDPYFYASIFFSPAVGFIAAAAAQPRPRVEEKRVSSTMKKCPDCAEMIQADALKCRFCGLVFTERD